MPEASQTVLTRIAGMQQGSNKVYHLPDPENPDRPACDGANTEGTEYRQRDVSRLGHRFRLCRYCDPNNEVDSTPGRTGKDQPSEKLLEMDPDDVPGLGGQHG